jgi:2-dehydro-3-deoxyphosphogluconate aldolase/(4S)-4-hydroxy-2-oxoglutarate aldolase
MKLPPAIVKGKVIPVARGLDATSAPVMVDALHAGGIDVIEITVEGSNGLGAIGSASRGNMLVGAGTVVTVSAAARAVDAGAVFLVTPHFDEKLLDWATMNAVPLIPGAFTPTEIAKAWEHRPPAVKLFPASLGGPDYVRSLLAPYPDLVLIPTGGIDADNAPSFLAAGAAAVGVGSWLTGPNDTSVITERARRLVSEVV